MYFIRSYLFYLIVYLFIFKNLYVNGEKTVLRFRNSLLRIYIASDKNKTYLIREYSNKLIKKIKTKINDKYYELNLLYNNLSEDEKEIIEFIISLCY